MKNRNQSKSPDEKTIRALLDKHGCPVLFHEVRTRFLGNIAAPDMTASPLRIVEGLWGGELPVFESTEEANELIGALVQGLWNDLTKHQKRSQPFRLTRLNVEPTAENFARFAQVRRQELEGFIEGLCNGQDRIDLPERAHHALGHLGELRAMMVGIEDLVARDVQAESRTQLENTFKHVRELTRIMEAEIHAAVLPCTRARRHMLEGLATEKPTLH
ncbi:hypothetical protein [Rhizorhapis sp. SPR117]|uniref:hypothetical protein n=1 Tax=Rhizorhapis sp. SPR117 TaxID=2912611 RepID=UPI001F1F3CDD|nr:hypothetical protein [Rhizorhapis sp. SPR117]